MLAAVAVLNFASRADWRSVCELSVPVMLPQTAPDPAETAAWTKAVVAICVVFVPAVAVGARGTPVKVGLARSALFAALAIVK